MAMSDPIADMLTRIRNAIQARQVSCVVPASSEKESILKILKQEGFVNGYVRQEEHPQDSLIVFLKYLGRGQRAIVNTLRRVSKPGRRLYRGYREFRPVLGGVGIAIVSTPDGIMTDKQAREKKVGGEVLCEVW